VARIARSVGLSEGIDAERSGASTAADDEWSLLWRGCVGGDPMAAEDFCRKVYPLVVRLFGRLTYDQDLASDRAQDFFVWLFEQEQHRLKSFRPELGVPLTSYLRLLAVRYHIDRTRSRAEKSRGREIGLDDAVHALTVRGDGERVLMSRELRKAVAMLPPREREATLWRLEGLRDGEIAKLMGIGAGGVGALLFRARERLRGLLEGSWCDPRPERDDLERQP
jgi:RNA polymerase sigma factor (sigma-70 family)